MSGAEFELKDERFPRTARALPAGRGTPVVRAGNAERRLEGFDPDRPAHDFTGRYIDDEDPGHLGGHPNMRLLVNQAGIHVQALLIFDVTAHRVRLMGNLGLDGTCPLVYAADPGRNAGVLMPGESSALLTLTDAETPGTHRLHLYSRQPTHFPHVFEEGARQDKDLADRAEALEYFPMYQPLRDRRLARLKADLVKELAAFFRITGVRMDDAVERDGQVQALSAAVQRAFKDLRSFEALQLEQSARSMLLSVEMTMPNEEGARTLWEWLQQAVAKQRKDGLKPTGLVASQLIRRLGVRGDAQRSTFKAKLMFEGVSTPGSGWIPSVKGYIAHLTLEKEGATSSWNNHYTLLFAGVGWGLSRSASLSVLDLKFGSGKGESDFDWHQDDVTGWCSLSGIGATAAAGLGVTKSVSSLIIQGPRSQTRPLVLDLSDLDPTQWEVGTIKGGGEVGVEASVLVGRVIDKGAAKVVKRRPEVVARKESAVLELAREQVARVHFNTSGSAVLKPDGRQLLRMLAALELPAFMDPDSRLAITGHTDRVDTWDRNLWLSYFRVQNVRRALEDILGKKLGIDTRGLLTERKAATDDEGVDHEWVARLITGNLTLQWFGELEAMVEGFEKDGTDNVKFRRVDLVLNHQLALQLGG